MITRRAPSASISRALSAVRIPPPTWQGKPPKERSHQCAVVSLSDGGIEINNLNQRITREAFDPGFEVIELERLLFSLHQLNDLASHQINRRDQHGHLMGIPAACNSCLSSPIGVMPR